MSIDPVVAAAIVGALISAIVTSGAAVWISRRTIRTQVQLNEANLISAKNERERAAKLNSYAQFLAAMEELVEVAELKEVSPGVDHASRESSALTSMNCALAMTDLLAPESVVHASTRAADIIELRRGEEAREALLDELINAMRIDVGIEGKIRTLRRGPDGRLVLD